jgi:hypothetical protein
VPSEAMLVTTVAVTDLEPATRFFMTQTFDSRPDRSAAAQVTMIGPAGVGQSRLISELERYASDHDMSTRLIDQETRCQR